MDLLSGIFLGLIYAATPGPVNVETLRRGVQGGYLDSLAVQSGSSVGRIIHALLAFLGAGLLLQGAMLRLVAGVFGMTALFYLGIAAIRDGHLLVDQIGGRAAGGGSAQRAFGTGAVLSLANPLAIVFWLSIGGRVLHDSGLDGPAFLGGFFAGRILSSLLVAFFASFWRARLSSRAARAISWTCGLAMIAFGLKLGLSVGQGLASWRGFH